jgi:hypothetical protein
VKDLRINGISRVIADKLVRKIMELGQGRNAGCLTLSMQKE